VSLPGGFSSANVTPAVLDRLPAAVHAGFVSGYAESIQTVFLIAVPIAALAFLASWLIPQVELRSWASPAASAAPAADAGAVAVAVDAASGLDDLQETDRADGTAVPQVELKQWTPAATAAPTAQAQAQAGEPQDTIPAADAAARSVSPESLDPQDAGRLDD
jgi:hypothetical protein